MGSGVSFITLDTWIFELRLGKEKDGVVFFILFYFFVPVQLRGQNVLMSKVIRDSIRLRINLTKTPTVTDTDYWVRVFTSFLKYVENL